MEDGDNLPAEHDVIVLGTGMTESIIAAAMSRIGLRVLHLERNDGYGGNWGSFNFSTMQQWISEFKSDEASSGAFKQDLEAESGEKILYLPHKSTTISNISVSDIIKDIPGPATLHLFGEPDQTGKKPDASDKGSDKQEPTPASDGASEEKSGEKGEKSSEGGEKPEEKAEEKKEKTEEKLEGKQAAEKSGEINYKTVEDVKKQWRRFAIDLMPKVLFSKGMLVELLIASDVAKYCEFRSVTRILTLIKGKLEKVPCSRADVFASHDVSVIEKRILMKLLTFCMEYQKHQNEYAGFLDKPFVEFLQAKKLTATIRHYVQHAIAMVTDSTPTLEGLAAVQKFLMSLGRYGNTAFLWPLYGTGELLQCFCRMCAVFGGVYCLRRSVKAIHVDSNNKLCGVTASNGQKLKAKWLIMDADYATPELIPKSTSSTRISRAIVITDRSFKPDTDQEHITVLSLPISKRTDSRLTVYELSSLSLSCPDGLYLVHLTCISAAENARADLVQTVETLFRVPQEGKEFKPDDRRPKALWFVYFNVDDTSKRDLTSSVENVIVVGGPDETLDCDGAIIKAKEVFEKVCPGEEFLPKAPNPEDIIYDDGENNQPKESGFEPIPEASGEAEIGESGLGSGIEEGVEGESAGQPDSETNKQSAGE